MLYGMYLPTYIMQNNNKLQRGIEHDMRGWKLITANRLHMHLLRTYAYMYLFDIEICMAETINIEPVAEYFQ